MNKNKSLILKSAICAGATAAILSMGDVPAASAASNIYMGTGTGLAGITLTLETYSETVAAEEAAAAAAEAAAQQAAEEAAAQQAAAEAAEAEAKAAEYANTGISVANDYVNIRKSPDTESDVEGKLYRGAAATIVETEGEWVKIQSGSVTGYIKSEYLAIGAEAEALEDTFGTKWATVSTETLKVREKKSTESSVLTLISGEEEFEVVKEYDGWVKLIVDEGDDENGEQKVTKGFVSADYVNVDVEFDTAISVEEEEEKLRQEEEARLAEEERLRELEESQTTATSSSSSSSSSSSESSSSSSSESSSSNSSSSSSKKSSSSESSSKKSESTSKKEESTKSEEKEDTASSDSSVQSGDGAAIAEYALKFVGNPYVYGGTSLTNGTDCSGFTMKVYEHFGISIPRTSSSQAGAGRKVSYSSLQKGDLIFYGSGSSVSHVALYIGGGQVVHASSRKTGIKISDMYYRTPITARRIVG